MKKFASEMALSLSRIGDIIAYPAGGKETAHQSTNTGEEELRFLAVAPGYRLKSLNIPACSQVSRQMKPEGRAQWCMSARRGEFILLGR
jgi:uncharacterized cupin superfamily protein